jgi:plastocyanin
MKADKSFTCLRWTVASCLGFGVLVSAFNVSAGSVTNVSITAAGFNPSTVAINVGDEVNWIWADNTKHSSTSLDTPPLWDSGPAIAQQGFQFSHTFSLTGSFPYWCTFHGFTGSVSVQAAATNVPPTIAINSPTNGATFAAPWTGTIQAGTSDPDDTVSKVDFFAGTTLLGTVSNPPASLSLTASNVAAGNYTLTAVATDSRGATNTSVGVDVKVVTPSTITLSSPQKPSANTFQFNYSADLGLSYIILRAANLATWVPLATNTAVSNPMPFTDNNATGSLDFYRVQLAPNP